MSVRWSCERRLLFRESSGHVLHMCRVRWRSGKSDTGETVSRAHIKEIYPSRFYCPCYYSSPKGFGQWPVEYAFMTLTRKDYMRRNVTVWMAVRGKTPLPMSDWPRIFSAIDPLTCLDRTGESGFDWSVPNLLATVQSNSCEYVYVVWSLLMTIPWEKPTPGNKNLLTLPRIKHCDVRNSVRKFVYWSMISSLGFHVMTSDFLFLMQEHSLQAIGSF